MTLYLLFEQLEAGRLKLSSELEVSPHAAAQAPSKLGLRPGESISVENAIRAVVTKSANDVAVVVAEAIGGTESDFATRMTEKAHALGMSRTLYRNASGLPNPEQITTARDQALLGRAIQERFPKYYRYFSTPSFTYRGHAMRNHNHLLGRVAGVDGIKTGYVEASGFNLVTSVWRGKRHLVAVVMGGRTGGARDARMRELIEQNINVASLQHTAPSVVQVASSVAPISDEEPQTASPRLPDETAKPVVVAQAVPVAPRAAADPVPSRVDPSATAAIPAPSSSSSDELRPIPVKTVKVRAITLQNTPLGKTTAAATTPVPPTSPAAAASAVVAITQPEAKAAEAAEAKDIAALASAAATDLPPLRGTSSAVAPQQPVPPPLPAAVAPSTTDTRSASLGSEAPLSSPTPRTETPYPPGWMIQVGALESPEAASQRIALARNKAPKILSHSSSFTEPVVTHEGTLYRARFAGLQKTTAEAACKALKRADIVCMTIKN
jgi:D-alanyl-D-alanine carboxypeptidase